MTERARIHRRTVVIGVGAVVLLGAGGAQALLRRERQQAAPPARRPAATARVIRETLAQETVLTGRLGYGTQQIFESKAVGTITWLPEPGAVISRGGVLMTADEHPVVALYGSLPIYRPLRAGSEGNDVAQLEDNLRALGHSGFTVDKEFNGATERAVRLWQRSLGLPETGVADASWVTYVDGAIRVAERRARVGSAASGQVFTYTPTTKVVTVDVRVDEMAWATKDAAVTVRLPDGGMVEGIVTAVGNEVSGSDSAAAADATVPVTIALGDQGRLGALERAPVEVRHVSQRREDILTVPVSALLALVEGGYGLEVVSDAQTRIITVQTGLVARGRVEVRGEGLAEGMVVGMPE